MKTPKQRAAEAVDKINALPTDAVGWERAAVERIIALTIAEAECDAAVGAVDELMRRLGHA